MSARLHLFGLLALAALLWLPACRHQEAPPPSPAPFVPYRFDDELATAATVSGSPGASSLQMAEPVSWDFSQEKTDWKLIRGRMGFRRGGELALQGQGSTPVIAAPPDPNIDWSRYRSVVIRMIAEGGTEIKIKIGNRAYRQPLGPPMRYRVYRFNIDITKPTFNWPLAIMPTDDLFATVAIDYIKLVPRMTKFTKESGLLTVGKRDEYRHTIYTYAPSKITYEVTIPKGGRLHFGIGIAEDKPVRFRVLAGAAGDELYSRKLEHANAWEDADIDLARYAGANKKIVFETRAGEKGAVALWANPLITTTAPKHRMNVLIYTVCTLRADHTSLYGYQRDTTPFLKKLGASSVVFDDCQAQATWTKASVASLFTSLYSFTHGIRAYSSTIPAGATTMAQQLRAAGYITASIIANPFAGRLSGLDRGFDYMMEYPVVHRQTTFATDRGTDSAAVNRVAFPWLEAHRDEPFFLYLLSTDPHAPYQPPPAFEKLFANPAETKAFNRDYDRMRQVRRYGGGAMISRAECRAKGIDPDIYRRRAVNRYDDEVAHNDHSIKLLVDKLKQLGIYKNTLLIVLSDHGEEFWEHGWSAHEHSLYSELNHVVLLMRNPTLIPTPRRVEEPVQLIDVLPTVADLLGIKLNGIVEGQSLTPLLAGKPFHREGTVMSSRFTHPNYRPNGVPENRTGTFARFDRDWKFLYRNHAKRAGLKEVELYDRHVDRKNLHDVAPQHPDLIRRFRKELFTWIKNQKKIRTMLGSRGTSKMDQQTMDRLRSLGYIK